MKITNNNELSKIFSSLYNKNYRKYFFANLLSYLSAWIQIIAENWLILELTKSGLALGIYTALQWGPMAFLGMHGGVIVDRSQKLVVFMTTQTCLALLAFAFGILVISGAVEVWMVWLGAFIHGIIRSYDLPAAQSFIKEVVGAEDLGNAVALNNIIPSLARMIGPAIAGVIILWVGVGFVFFVTASTLLLGVVILASINKDNLHKSDPPIRKSGQISETVSYIKNDSILLQTTVIMLIVFILIYNFQVYLPIISYELLNGTSATYGLLMSILGAGSLLGSIVLARRVRTSNFFVTLSVLSLAFVMLLLSVVTDYMSILLASFALGIAASLFTITVSTRFQYRATDQIRGRVMAVYSILFLGTGLVGGPLVGWLIEWIGLIDTLRIVSVICFLALFLIGCFSIKSKTWWEEISVTEN